MTVMAEPRLVLRPFGAGGRDLVAGEIVDVAGWRNVAVLERSRRLGPVPREDAGLFNLGDEWTPAAAPDPAPTKTTKARRLRVAN